jgi:hypothetical protein
MLCVGHHHVVEKVEVAKIELLIHNSSTTGVPNVTKLKK